MDETTQIPDNDPTKLQLTPLESDLQAHWHGKDISPSTLPWEQAKARAKARIAAFALGTGADVPEEIDHWYSVLPAEWMIRLVLAVRVTGSISLACRRAKVSPYVLDKWRMACPEFAEAILRAREQMVDTVESAVLVSATTGDREPVFDKGLHVGWKRRKSEKAAELLLRAKRPAEYRPELGAGVQVSVQLQSGEAVRDALLKIAGNPATQICETSETAESERVVESQ